MDFCIQGENFLVLSDEFANIIIYTHCRYQYRLGNCDKFPDWNMLQRGQNHYDIVWLANCDLDYDGDVCWSDSSWVAWCTDQSFDSISRLESLDSSRRTHWMQCCDRSVHWPKCSFDWKCTQWSIASKTKTVQIISIVWYFCSSLYDHYETLCPEWLIVKSIFFRMRFSGIII